MNELAAYLAPTEYFDFEDEAVRRFVAPALEGVAEEPVARARALYLSVRDGVRYNPYSFSSEGGSFRASKVAGADESYCIPKAVLLGAAARAVGIPSRLGLANVRNHLSSPKLIEHLRSDVFAMHGYIELHLEGRWVKATPAFDAGLCERLDVAPLAFDGRSDSIFQEFTRGGQKHMEYLEDHGTHADVPVALILSELARHYPHLVSEEIATAAMRGSSLQSDLDEESLG